jgi:hypothetical protein
MMIRRELKHGNEREVDSFDSGNCIFSSSPMGFQKEDGYTGVQKKLNSNDRPAEVRCYFGQKVDEERAKVALCTRRGSRKPPRLLRGGQPQSFGPVRGLLGPLACAPGSTSTRSAPAS